MKLKTLKDINPIIAGRISEAEKSKYRAGIGSLKCFLKQEAIKHIKDKENNAGFNLPATTISWIKYFFNITEEDLK